MKRIAALLLAFAACAVSVAGCGRTPAAPDTDATAAETDAPGGADLLPLLGEGAPEYIIVRGDNAPKAETDAAVFLRRALTACGMSVKITTDWEKNPVSEYEFVVGDTLRAAADPAMNVDAHTLGEEGFYVKAAGSRIYLGGGSSEAVRTAVEYFLSAFFGYSGDESALVPLDAVSVPADYEILSRQSLPITSVSVAGRPLGEFRIVSGQPSNRRLAEAAELIQTTFYKDCGIWLEIADKTETWDGPAIRLLPDAADKAGCFQLDVENGDLVLRTDLNGGHARGFRKFYREYFENQSGGIHLDANLRYETDIGSYVTYADFGAKGDGKTNDIAAIIAAHEYANANGLTVRGDEGATYYVSDAAAGAVVQTDVDWTGCSFVIDDSNVGLDRRGVAIFNVTSQKAAYSLGDALTTLKAGQENLGVTLPEPSIVVLTNANVKHYIREGKNANNGSDQTDILIVAPDGSIDPAAPIMWDYDAVTGVSVTPMDQTTLTLKGGTFTTIANRQDPSSNYYTRGISIRRSNVVVDGLVHYVTGEGDKGSPYSGILVINSCANIEVRNCTFTAHKTYTNIKPTGAVSQGTYDISPSRVVNLTFRDCTQTTDILDTKYWGVIGSNFCKNITLENCNFSRFDAHQGVVNVTIRGCTLGHQCLNAIGQGMLWVEDTTLYGNQIINLRSDYGSTWHGEVMIKNCTWIPNRGNTLSGGCAVVSGSYSGFHDFGYECWMPTKITIDGLHVVDGNHTSGYQGVYLLGNITSAWTSAAYEAKVEKEGFPYHLTETITISNFISDAGYTWRLSPNTYMFRGVTVVDLDRK